MEHIPRRNPMACEAPAGPQMSKAIGPSMVMKHPSKRPMTRANTIMASNLRSPKKGAAVSSIVHRPMETKLT